MKRVRFVGAAVVVLVLQGCGSQDCSSVALPGLSVQVQDPSGVEVCDAVVTATAGDHAEVLSAGGTAQDLRVLWSSRASWHLHRDGRSGRRNRHRLGRQGPL